MQTINRAKTAGTWNEYREAQMNPEVAQLWQNLVTEQTELIRQLQRA